MGTPMRITSGFTQDAAWQPLGQIGQPNPFYYSTYYDDYIGYLPGRYTNTTTSAGTIAQSAGEFGRVLFTTNATTPLATDICSQQIDSAAFTVASNYKLAYLTRLQIADVTNPQITIGLIQTTTTPFTVTDGIYFNKPSGSNVITLYIVSGSATTGSVALSTAFVANTDIDLGFLYDGKGNVQAFVGSGLVGQKRQDFATLGPMAKLTPTSFPTAVLNPTLAIQSGTTASTTMNVDFQYCARER